MNAAPQDFDLLVPDSGSAGRDVARKCADAGPATAVADTTGWYSSLRVAAPASGYEILVEPGSGRIPGGHFLGPGAEEQVNVLAAAPKSGLDARALSETLFANPSWASDLGAMLRGAMQGDPVGPAEASSRGSGK